MKNLSNKNHHRIKHLKRIPLPYNQGKKNNIENTEEDEEETIETNQLKEYKRKLSDYPPKNNANRNIRIDKKIKKISSFILKEDKIDKYRTVPARKSLKPSKSVSPFRPYQKDSHNSNDKYEIKIPFRRDQSQIYEKEDDNNNPTIINHYYCNVIHNNNYCVSLEPEEKRDKQMEKIVTIQSNYRGFYVRNTLIDKLKSFINYHSGIQKIINILILKIKKYSFDSIRNYYKFDFKKITNKVFVIKKNTLGMSAIKRNGNGHTIGLSNLKGVLNKNVLAAKLGLRVLKKELIESFEINVGKKEKNYTQSQLDQAIDEVREKYHLQEKKNSLYNIIKINKTKKDKILGLNFNKLSIQGKISVLHDNFKKTIQGRVLKNLLTIKVNKGKMCLQKRFSQFLVNGLLKQMTIYQKERDEANEKWRLHKIIEEKEAEKKRLLKVFFNRMYHNTNTNKLREAIKQSKIQKEEQERIAKEKKLYKLFVNKQLQKKKFIHGQFTKLFYKGIFVQMVLGQIKKYVPDLEIIQKNQEIQDILRKSLSKETIESNQEIHNILRKSLSKQGEVNQEKPIENQDISKEETSARTQNQEKNLLAEKRKKARELRKLIANKGKNHKETLKLYFMKFYLAGIKSKMIISTRRSVMDNGARFSLSVGEEAINDSPKFKVGRGRKQISPEEEKEIKRKEEEAKKNKEIEDKFLIVFYLKERSILLVKKDKLKKWNIKAKLDRLHEMGMLKKKKKGKKGKKKVSKGENKSMDLLGVQGEIKQLIDNKLKEDISEDSINQE